MHNLFAGMNSTFGGIQGFPCEREVLELRLAFAGDRLRATSRCRVGKNGY